MGGKYICQYPDNEGEICEKEVHDQKDVIFTGKDASDPNANKMAV